MKFDTLDYVAFSHQQFDRFKESHADNIIVTWPDGHETQGLETHIKDMKAMFVPMPDLAIKEHPIKDHTATGKKLDPHYGDHRPLDGCRCDGPRMVVLGQPGIHEASGPGADVNPVESRVAVS